MIRTHGITHVHLLVRDLERSLRFYEEVFGFTRQLNVGKLTFLTTPGTGDLLTLSCGEHATKHAGPGGGIEHFGFRLEEDVNVDDAVEVAVKGGAALIQRGEHAPGWPFAYLTDPDGYLIEIWKLDLALPPR